MIITQTPLRVSFVGGGTDFPQFFRENGGAVISTAIDKFMYVVVKERYDSQIVVNWSKKERVDSVDELEHELIREAMKMTGVTDSVEITTLSDIPAHGSGLGSSAAVTVGALNALWAFRGNRKTAQDLAKAAIKIEIDILKKPIGVQDQYICAYGGFKYLRFWRTGDVDVGRALCTRETLVALNQNTLLFFSGEERKAENVLSEQVSLTRRNFANLCQMKDLVEVFRTALIGTHPDVIGNALDQAWQLKQTFASGISNAKLNAMYQTAIDAGAIGGKLLGAGGGGFFLFYAKPECHDAIRAALGLQEYPFTIWQGGSEVIFEGNHVKSENEVTRHG